MSSQREERSMSDSHMRRAFTALSAVTPAISKVTSVDDLMRLVARQACALVGVCLLYTSPSPRDRTRSRMPSSA